MSLVTMFGKKIDMIILMHEYFYMNIYFTGINELDISSRAHTVEIAKRIGAF